MAHPATAVTEHRADRLARFGFAFMLGGGVSAAASGNTDYMLFLLGVLSVFVIVGNVR